MLVGVLASLNSVEASHITSNMIGITCHGTVDNTATNPCGNDNSNEAQKFIKDLRIEDDTLAT